MKTTFAARFVVAALFFAFMVSNQGCGNKAATEEAKMKESMTHPQAFDINKVPPEKRAMVNAMMAASKNAGPNKPPTLPRSDAK